MTRGQKARREGGPREELRAKILSMGFHRVGFASAEESPGASHLHEWISRGFHGEMHYLARNIERRSDPRQVLSGVKTVIVVAIDYRPPSGYGVANPRTDVAEISSYARGVDYHRVLESRLKQTSRTLAETFSEERFRYYVDTGPVLEKAWAQRAGVGWVGKNTCSIDRNTGSFFFLGVILTTLEILADEPATDHCGSCRLCIDACPTDAFVEPYVLDARRCISYLTIEHRGAIDSELEDGMGNLIFGCDVCQEVCPFNDSESSRFDPELTARPENVFPPLEELAALSPEAFRDRFPHSPVRRAKYRGFLRNVIIALGNSGRQEYLELLRRIADHGAVERDPVLGETLARARAKLEKSRTLR